MLSSILLATSAIAVGVSAQACPAVIGAAGVQVRLPSVYVEVDASVDVDVDVNADINILGLVDIDVDASLKLDLEASVKAWVAPSVDFLFGRTWYMTKTSSPQYANMTNVQCELTPTDVTSSTTEVDYLLSFQVGADVAVNTLYGVQTAQAGYPTAWVFASTGLLASVSANVTIIAWGCDQNGHAYYLLHSSPLVGTNVAASLSLFSASPSGVDSITISAIVAAVVKLNIVDISVLVQAFVSVGQDGTHTIPVSLDHDTMNASTNKIQADCKALCQTNQGLLGNPLIRLVANVFKA